MQVAPTIVYNATPTLVNFTVVSEHDLDPFLTYFPASCTAVCSFPNDSAPPYCVTVKKSNSPLATTLTLDSAVVNRGELTEVVGNFDLYVDNQCITNPITDITFKNPLKNVRSRSLQ